MIRYDDNCNPTSDSWYSKTLELIEIDHMQPSGQKHATRLFKKLSNNHFLIIHNAYERTQTHGWTTTTEVVGSKVEDFSQAVPAMKRWLSLSDSED